MNDDIQKLIADARAIGARGFMATDQYSRQPYGWFYRLADALEALNGENETMHERLGDIRDEQARQVASYQKRLENTTSNYLIRSQAARDAEAERDALRARFDSMTTETRRATRGPYYTDDFQIITEQRLVGPWVEVKS